MINIRWLMQRLFGGGNHRLDHELKQTTTELVVAKQRQMRATDHAAYAVQELLSANDRRIEAQYRRP